MRVKIAKRYSLPLSTRLKVTAAVAVSLCLFAIGWQCLETSARRSTAELPSKLQVRDSRHHNPLRMVLNVPGVSEPTFVDSAASNLADAAPVIGIVVDGRAFAFAQQAMSSPDNHVVNLTIGRKPFSITYCDMAECVRVLTRNGETDPIDLQIGGLDFDQQLVLLLDGVRYGQSSPAIPLQDYTFETTTLANWKARFPGTRIYEG